MSDFQFKQFSIRHDRCAMKVGTDGILLGAWTNVDAAETVLDIGTGSGLLALMMAQRNSKAEITAIEIEQNAFVQASENVLATSWGNRILVKHTSIQEFAEKHDGTFDLIICNPPFFSTGIQPPSTARRLARHTDELSHLELLTAVKKLLSTEGLFSMIIPFEAKKNVLNCADSMNLFPSRITNVNGRPNTAYKRVLLELGKNTNLNLIEKNESIYKFIAGNKRSDYFQSLSRDFYL